MPRHSLLLSLLLLGNMLGCSSRRHADVRADLIVYVGSESRGNNANESEPDAELALMTTDGTGEKRTVYRFESPYRARSVTWSPQTKLACVVVAEESHAQLWAIDLEGNVRHKTDLPSSEDEAPTRPYIRGGVLITTFTASNIAPGPKTVLKRLNILTLDPGNCVRKSVDVANSLPPPVADSWLTTAEP
jgi:hypothetical protein